MASLKRNDLGNRGLLEVFGVGKNSVVRKNMVPESISVDELLQKSEAGVPELVYRQICDYCGLSWEGGLAKWLIQ